MKNKMLDKMLIEYEEPKKFQQLRGGIQKLLRFYYNSKDEKNLSKMLIVDDIVWDTEMESFVYGLKEYGVKELVFHSTWSSSIELLMYLVDNGYQVKGTIAYKEDKWFCEKQIKKGLKLVLKKGE